LWPWSVFVDEIEDGLATVTRLFRQRFPEILIAVSVTGLAYVAWIAWRQ
jgi:hypothetical protein